jgi:metal transporter CNNM
MKLRWMTLFAVLAIAGLLALVFWVGNALLGLGLDWRWLHWMLFLLGYGVCSGSNVAYFAFSLRELKIAALRGKRAETGSLDAMRAERAAALMGHLRDPNWTLAAILLTNVGFGVRVSQLSEDLFVGILAVIMPIIFITVVGEFFAQAAFLRFASLVCYLFSPFIWLLKIITAPVSWPLARLVDAILGREGLRRLNEKDLLSDLELELKEFGVDPQHPHAEVLDPRELRLLMNAARADDELARHVGQPLAEETIVPLPFHEGMPIFPDDPLQFARQWIDSTSHAWLVIVNEQTGHPHWLLDADGFLRDLSHRDRSASVLDFHAANHLFRGRIYHEANVPLGRIMSELQVYQEHAKDEVIDIDVALIWSAEGRWIVTGGDILGRLLRGISRRRHWRHLAEDRRRGQTKISSSRRRKGDS